MMSSNRLLIARSLMGIVVTCAVVACGGVEPESEETATARGALTTPSTPAPTPQQGYDIRLELCLNLCKQNKKDDDALCQHHYGTEGTQPNALALNNCLAQARAARNVCDDACDAQFGSGTWGGSSGGTSSGGTSSGGTSSGGTTSSSSGGSTGCDSCAGRTCGLDPCAIALSCGDCAPTQVCNHFGSCEETKVMVNGGCTANYQCGAGEVCNLATGDCCGGTMGCHKPLQE